MGDGIEEEEGSGVVDTMCGKGYRWKSGLGRRGVRYLRDHSIVRKLRRFDGQEMESI